MGGIFLEGDKLQWRTTSQERTLVHEISDLREEDNLSTRDIVAGPKVRGSAVAMRSSLGMWENLVMCSSASQGIGCGLQTDSLGIINE